MTAMTRPVLPAEPRERAVGMSVRDVTVTYRNGHTALRFVAVVGFCAGCGHRFAPVDASIRARLNMKKGRPDVPAASFSFTAQTRVGRRSERPPPRLDVRHRRHERSLPRRRTACKRGF